VLDQDIQLFELASKTYTCNWYTVPIKSSPQRLCLKRY